MRNATVCMGVVACRALYCATLMHIAYSVGAMHHA